MGSASDETGIEAQETAAVVAPGEVVPIMVATTYASRGDVAVVVTWRGRTGKAKRWTHLLT
ncbi:hypothetical protein DKT74_14255 [Streptomyces sp. ZEA17I]|uniref:hypothetical protein n=1 Tax=Streptomyces sp. ZEA17I TaxID=2202516 RepID=UPI000D6FC4C5|nr:hypothetical protein [Streptomyces sp. ZEA17I]PWS43898.1 hypothetical protein DKT74_14255 [Streptomyces sp. ZEA17I]